METDLVFVTVKDLDSLKSLGSVCTVQQLTCVELISGTPEHQRLASDMDAGDQLKSVLDGCYPKLSIFDNTNTHKNTHFGASVDGQIPMVAHLYKVRLPNAGVFIMWGTHAFIWPSRRWLRHPAGCGCWNEVYPPPRNSS